MKKNLDQWDRIADLIAMDRKTALDEFHRRKFYPAEVKARPAGRLFRLLAIRRVFWLAAASLFLAIGLVSFWLLRGNWNSAPTSPAGSELLAGSFLYGRSGRPVLERGANVLLDTSAPLFTAWATAGMERLAAAESTGHAAAIDPEVSVVHVDPEEVRRRIGQVIREGAIEQMLQAIREIHNKEA